MLTIDELQGATAADYGQHIIESVGTQARTYSDFHKKEYQNCRQSIIGNISNTLTDLVASNHAAMEIVKDTWDKNLNKLICHLHPLETVASSCRSALKGPEEKKGHMFVKDCVVGNTVLQMNQIRFKDGKGEPKNFAGFFRNHNLPKRLIPRYGGKRLHVLFHICGVYTEHHKLLREFLTTGTVSCG